MKKIQNFFTLHRIAACLILVVIGLLIFKAGVYVGYKKAGFILPGGHGVAGKVLEVSPTSLTVEGPDNTERTVTIGKETMVRKFRDMASTTAIQVNDRVVVIGAPGPNGDIAAKLIRILPQK